MVDAAGRLKWEELGCYKLDLNEGHACSILHCSGDAVAVPAHVTIDADFVLSSAYSDGAASVQNPPSDAIKLHQCFADSKKGPYRFSAWKAIKCKPYEQAVARASEKPRRTEEVDERAQCWLEHCR
eukprot:TRINITY_DN42500_c0_g1_i1.p2 TRINITY_DN42500_c0_g1~~TRINITY_DN42500_c0_g1_i1.p2  ORF type:complete len:137 (-),score=31.67 TRINITY_DN42500_c0_g1_i1:35-412(-)